MPNTERLLGLLAWAEQENDKKLRGEPSQWDQGDWFRRDREVPCGTACCMAGKVALDDGLVPEPTWRSSLWNQAEDGTTGAAVVLPNGRRETVDVYAQAALGLDDEQANELFAAFNTIEDIREIIQELTS